MTNTRETWLNAVTAKMAPWFADLGSPLPKVRCSVGFPSAGAKGRAIGECWTDACSADGTHEIFITPRISDSSRVADILAHELVHAAVGIPAGHGPKFRKVAKAIGLAGKMTATIAGPLFLERISPILAEVGPIPHASLDAAQNTAKKKQGTRLLKCACGECGYTIRITRTWLEVATPMCPVCEVEMIV